MTTTSARNVQVSPVLAPRGLVRPAGAVRYQGVTVVGAIVPPQMLDRIQNGEVEDSSSLTPTSYGLPRTYSVRDAANASWRKVQAAWRQWREDAVLSPGGQATAEATQHTWLEPLLYELGWGQLQLSHDADASAQSSLTFGGAPASRGIRVGDKLYPISHRAGAVPVHLLGPAIDLDHSSPGVPGAERAPQAMVQELLNRSDAHLWAVVSNGSRLRLLRDSTALVGASYLEFDLDAIVEGELFAEFLLLWQVCHHSRFLPRDGAESWLEKWRSEAVEAGTRLLDRLRDGVLAALQTLGSGFLHHPDNAWLVQALRSGDLTRDQYRQALLRTVYRLLFCFVTEDQPTARRVLPDPDAPPRAQARYRDYFATTRLRADARRLTGSLHPDLWQAQRLVLEGLGSEDGLPDIAVPALGGIFDPDTEIPRLPGAPHADLLLGAELSNRDLLAAVRSLAWTAIFGERVQPVDYRNLGAVELGSVYESLLEYEPQVDLDASAFTLKRAAGNDRKKSGSYYTPSDLIDLVLDTALDPLLDQAVAAATDTADAERRLLELTICDPACGSGHFLVAASRRLAARLAAVRAGGGDPTPDQTQIATYDVVARCVFGVDLNPMAVALAKVSLWLEAARPGRPLTFLDAHVKIGNALLGATPALIAAGIPDGAYLPLDGDDRTIAAELKRLNAGQRREEERTQQGQGSLLDVAGLRIGTGVLRRNTAQIAARHPANLSEVHDQARRLAELADDPETASLRRVADAWCAAFVQRMDDVSLASDGRPGPTAIIHSRLGELQELTPAEAENSAAAREVAALAQRYRFFHWHLEFPEVFAVPEEVPQPLAGQAATGWTGGFGCVLGNPPWERVKLQEKEFFATRDPDIAGAPNAAKRKSMIAALPKDSVLSRAWHDALRNSDGQTHLLRASGRYPLTGTGDVNTYSVFAETMRALTRPDGRMGVITPTGLGTEPTTAAFFADTLRAGRLAAFYDFENEAKIFSEVHHSYRFAATVISGGDRVGDVGLAFYTRHIADVPERRFVLSSDEVLHLNPNTGNLPVFRTRADAEITLAVYRRHPVLIRDNGGSNTWNLRFVTMLHMANDSNLFLSAEELERLGAEFDGWEYRASRDREDREWLPLYEAKLLSHYDHRFSSYAGATQAQLNVGTLPRLSEKQHNDPNEEPLPRYWVASTDVNEALIDQRSPQKTSLWERKWMLGWRDVARASDSRTFIPSVLPRSAVGHGFPLAFPLNPDDATILQAIWSSLIFDYIARQKLSGTHLIYSVLKQISCPAPALFREPARWSQEESLGDWIRPRVLELAYTSYRLSAYAQDNGDGDSPFQWIPERRALIRAELDAAMLHEYGLTRTEAEHVIDSFGGVRDIEVGAFGEFRTRRLVLERYDALAAAAAEVRRGGPGAGYRSPLEPAPGSGPRHPAAPQRGTQS